MKQLRVCAERKFYLQEFVAVAVCRLLGSVPEGVVRVELVPVLGLGGGWKTCTPETLYVMLELNKKYEKVLGFLKHRAAVHTSTFSPSHFAIAWLVQAALEGELAKQEHH